MSRPQPLVAIIALAAFMLSGGLGAGARWTICTEVDGSVHLESALNRCCDEDHAVAEGAEPQGAVESLPAFTTVADDCGSCIDTPIPNDAEGRAVVRVAKAVPAFQLDTPAEAVLPPPVYVTDGVTRLLPASSPGAPSATSHLTVQTVVLRC